MPVSAAPSTQQRKDAARYSRPAGPRDLDRFDLAVVAAVAAASLAFLAVLFLRGGIWAGWEGFVVGDQGQYLNWVRQSGDHLLIGNSFDLKPDSHVYLQPPLLISGLLHRLGLSVPLAYLVWKPVGVAVLFWGTWRYVGRALDGVKERRAALVLALFFVSPAALLSPLWGEAGRGTFDFISGESWPVGQLWGYPLAAITIGLTPLALLAVEREVARGGVGRPGRAAWTAGACALVVSWLHPWQGATLAGIVVISGLWHLRAGGAGIQTLARSTGPALVGAIVPALYFFILARVDPSWAIGEDNYRVPLDFASTWRVGVALAPLALPALLTYRAPVAGLQERMLRTWAPVALALYLVPATPVRFHAFNGVSIPLAILAVRGLAPYVAGAAAPSAERRRLVLVALVVVCAGLTLPGVLDRVRSARGAVELNQQPFHLEPGERDALNALEENPARGGVLTTEGIGALVPYETGRETYVGTPSWTPDYGPRAGAAGSLLAGGLSPGEARRFVRSTGARFILADCHGRADLRRALAPLLARTTRFGCATVYELRSPG